MRIFVSHSSFANDYATSVWKQVAKLRPADQLLVDTESLRPGEDWCAVLYDWMARCDAAMILFNRKALKSPWVRREANILLWRRAVNPSFDVIPALLGDLEIEDLQENGFDDVNRLQVAQIPRKTETRSGARELASKIAAGFTGQFRPADDPMVEWVGRVAKYLRAADPKQTNYFNDAARALGIDDRHLPPNWDQDDSHRLLAAQMLGEGLRGGRLLNAARRLVYAFMTRDPFQALLYEVAPSWVDGQAARRLLPPPQGPADRRVLILNANRQEIAGQYVDRANFNVTRSYREIATTCQGVGEGGAEELVALFERQIRESLGAEYYPPDDHDFAPLDGLVYYLLVQVGKVPLTVVAQAVRVIHEWHPWLVVVLLTGDWMPGEAELRSAGLDQAVPLVPALARGDESSAYQLRQVLAGLTARWDPLWRAAS